MTRTPTVRRLAAQEWRLYRDLRLRALADSPDAFERTFDEARALPDDAWQARLAEGTSSERSLPLVAELGEPVGLAWGRITPEALSPPTATPRWALAHRSSRIWGWEKST